MMTITLRYPGATIGSRVDSIKGVERVVSYKSHGAAGTEYITENGAKCYTPAVLLSASDAC
jgi:hypothetical protein